MNGWLPQHRESNADSRGSQALNIADWPRLVPVCAPNNWQRSAVRARARVLSESWVRALTKMHVGYEMLLFLLIGKPTTNGSNGTWIQPQKASVESGIERELCKQKNACWGRAESWSPPSSLQSSMSSSGLVLCRTPRWTPERSLVTWYASDHVGNRYRLQKNASSMHK